MKISFASILPAVFMLVFSSCKKEDTGNNSGPSINFVFKFDSTQVRLNALGQPVSVPAGHGAQSPRFNLMSAHYLEMTKDQFTALGAGSVLYLAPETTAGGSRAIDFSKATFAGQGQTFLSVPVSSLAPGTYNWLRVSLAYQNYNINFRASGMDLTGTLASFIGYRTFLQNFKVKDSTVTVNANKDQGFWAFETNASGFGFVSSGQAPPGATTVPNPLFATSPIPQGSCVVTGQFASPLVITGSETSDITIVVSLSTNKSFEWNEVSGPGTFDPSNGDQVVDMGIRGMIPSRL